MTKKEIKALISLLEDEDREVASHIEQKIVSLGEGIIPFLEEEWEETLDSDLQKKIEDLIHNLQFEGLMSRLVAWKENGAENLLEGMWLVNSYLYPDVEFSTITKEIDQLYFEAWRHMKTEMHPYDQVKSLNNVLFREKRFSANTKNFHSPANSMLHLVLESKRGNPLTLCVIYLILAQRLEMPVYGVNLPNLFILTYKLDGLQFYINVYNKGLILSKADIDNYILQLNLNPIDIFYEPCSNLDIIKRALRNLAFSFEKMDDMEKSTEVIKLLTAISDDDIPLTR
ncbi:regulator of sirC expression with transglutaminase-like and TPR domain [Pontibacter ummariensis]|uniref:Regulator of sirC expression, contains transglutaminase-like and TPR domains n=1 Tax=Pontibacter ummariensis TaxID=1610492 RepID=A0A239BET3_9BACT|nr:transglutaminase-like domain-containing protein [Pontibacter ummariensis]PRY16461.1 regulator of sirC expression with transglutaminase-like and TPR domain [Pontibacter ummariensis]SNS05563.1 Regulator of sirC expression, contains transglutaminase-like and TPR domains [Pontibacter ummariensis]